MNDEQRVDFMSVVHDLYRHTAIAEVIAFPLLVTSDYFRTLFRRRVMWVRNWQATPMIVESKAKWVLTYERRRFFRWIPVQAAVVDTLDECFALVKHRRQAPIKFALNDEGNVTGTTTFNLHFKVNSDAPDELRPKDADYRAEASGGTLKVRTTPAEKASDGCAESGEASQDATHSDGKDRTAEEVAKEVSGDSTEVLEGRKR